MSNHNNNRVLSRMGSRELTPEEVAIAEKAVNTNIFTCCSDVTGDGHF